MKTGRRAKNRKGRGYLLGAVLAVLAILLTLVAALQYQGMARRRNAVIMEAQYLAERSAENLVNNLDSSLVGVRPSGMPDMFFADGTVTDNTSGPNYTGEIDKNIVYMDSDIYYRGANQYAGKIWADSDFLGVGTSKNVRVEDSLQGRTRRITPHTLRVEGHPTSWNPQYDLYRRTRYKSVYQAGFPYAAFAPGKDGTIELEKVSTWTLPAQGQLNEKKDHPLEQHSGLRPYVGAGKDVTVGDFRYGDAYSKAGEISVKGGAIGFNGYLPYENWGRKTYFQYIQQSLSAASSKLNSVATNKTGAVFGKLTLSDTIRLITKGSSPKNFLTYQAAAAWWFYMIPTVKAVGPSLEIRLHIPMPADTQLAGDAAASAPKIKRINELQSDIKNLENQLLPESVSDDESKWDKNTPGMLPKLNWKTIEFQNLETELATLKQEYRNLEASGAKQSELDAKQNQIDSKQDEVNTKRDEIDSLDKEVQRKEDTVAAKKRTVETLQEELKSTVSSWVEGDPKGPDQSTDFLMTMISVGEPVDPNANAKVEAKPANSQKKKKDDKTKLLSSKGMLYHSYAGIMVRLAAQFRRLLVDAVTSFPMKTIRIKLPFKTIKFKIPDLLGIPRWLKNIGRNLLNGLKNMIVYEVPLVYLDGQVIKPISGSNFSIEETFNVPPGRTFKLEGSMTIKGDLWLQKGSSMILTGDLKMVQPGRRDAVFKYGEMMLPQGRIWMEEGSSLVVSGNIEAQGDKYLGSIVACGPGDMNHGLTATVICSGEVRLPHGTGGGMTLEELVVWVKDKSAGDIVRKLMEQWVPNLSKTPRYLGPFQYRSPYFGRYPVTFRVFPPSPVPIPTFEPTGQNMNVHMLRMLTEIFNIQLNLTLGENFTTVCIWWASGSEQTAIFPKSAASSTKKEISRSIDKVLAPIDWARRLDPESILGDLLKECKALVSKPDIIGKTLVVVAVEAANPDPTGASQVAVDKALEELLGKGTPGSLSELVMSRINPIIKVPGGKDFSIFEPLKNAIKDIEDAVNGLSPSSGLAVSEKQEQESAHMLLVECPGVFIYGERSIQIGPSNWYDTPSVRAVGCFVSNGDITANARYTIGSLMSGNGRIKARELYYTPSFTRTSVYKPKELQKGGRRVSANDDYWANAVNIKYGKQLDTKEALDVPSLPVFFKSAEGWGP